MLHTVFYDMRNALLSVRVWRVRAGQQQVERPETGEQCSHVRTHRLRRRGTRADGTGQHSTAPLWYRLSSSPCSSLSARASFSPQPLWLCPVRQSASGRDVVVVEYQFVRVSSSVLRWPEESYRPNPLVLVSITILFLRFCFYYNFDFYSCSLYFVVVFVLPRTMPSPQHSSKWV